MAVRPHTYRDPLDDIWIGAAARIGFRVTRGREAYAATDGAGIICVGEKDLLDADDCLAQIILHELCHALVEGEAAWTRPDWGLDNTGVRDEAREQACLRVQAQLAGRFGLRRVLAATTEHRPFYDALPDDAVGDDPAARAALGRAFRVPFAPHLGAALAATARVARDAAPWARATSLLAQVTPAHAAGLALGPEGRTCGDCVWRRRGRCLQGGGTVDALARACVAWEGALDCQTCGACCRDAYDSVTVGRRDPAVRRHPELVVAREGYLEIRRDGDRCAALAKNGRWACRIYETRPRPCRDFPVAGESCLTARQRVGLSVS